MRQRQQNQDERYDHEKDNPALSKVIERNIRTIIHLTADGSLCVCLTHSPTDF